MGRPLKHDWAVIDPKLREMAAAGWTVAAIAEAVGVSPGTIGLRLSQIGAPTTGNRHSKHDWAVIDPKLREMAAKGMPRTAIAKAVGLPLGTVGTRLLQINVQTTGKRGAGATARGKDGAFVQKFEPTKGRMPALNYLPPSELQVDPEYQRSIEGKLSQRLISRIARQWDWSRCLPLLVSDRGVDGLFVIDGQHRLTAALMRGDITQLPCVVVAVGGREGEAALFEAVNSQRRPLSPLELFRAALASGDAEAQAILAAIQSAGLTLAPHENAAVWKPGMIGNVGGIRHAWRQYGGRATSKALGALAEGFEGQVLRFAGTIFGALPKVVMIGDGAGLAALLASQSQEQWRAAIMQARANDPSLNWRRAGFKALSDAGVKARLGSGAVTAINPALFIGGYAWCEQCEAKTKLPEARGCKSRFCPFKTAPAAAAAKAAA